MIKLAGMLFILLGVASLTFGELFVAAWCLYDVIHMIQTETATFLNCVWLAFLYLARGILVGVVGMVCMFLGGMMTSESGI
jgi:hypothetical protein